jgi:hypothetical protein
MDSQPKRLKVWIVVGSAAVGAALGGAAIAGAATGGSSSSTSAATSATSAPTGAAPSNRPDPATLSHGPNETLLTGTTADKVKAAALAAVPGGTIIRVETDSAGSPYEAHVKKADGTEVTVKVDASFNVTATQPGFGAGPNGAVPPGGGVPGSSPNA